MSPRISHGHRRPRVYGAVRLLLFGRPYDLGEFFGKHRFQVQSYSSFSGTRFFRTGNVRFDSTLPLNRKQLNANLLFVEKQYEPQKAKIKIKYRLFGIHNAWKLFSSAAIFVFFHYYSIQRPNINEPRISSFRDKSILSARAIERARPNTYVSTIYVIKQNFLRVITDERFCYSSIDH